MRKGARSKRQSFSLPSSSRAVTSCSTRSVLRITAPASTEVIPTVMSVLAMFNRCSTAARVSSSRQLSTAWNAFLSMSQAMAATITAPMAGTNTPTTPAPAQALATRRSRCAC
ncbi:hypothetical protein D3C79_679110 [compost metagenome]